MVMADIIQIETLVITSAVYGCSSRGPILLMTLDGIGRVEITARELTTSRRFVRAVFRQTGIEIEPMNDRAWHRWLADCLRKNKLKVNS